MKKTLALASTALLALALSFGSVQVGYAKENVKVTPKTEKVADSKTTDTKKECCDKSKACKKDKDCKGTCDSTKKCKHMNKAKKSK